MTVPRFALAVVIIVALLAAPEQRVAARATLLARAYGANPSGSPAGSPAVGASHGRVDQSTYGPGALSGIIDAPATPSCPRGPLGV